MDKEKGKKYYTKNELIQYIAEKNEVSTETIKSFINRKSSLSNYKDDKGNFKIPVNVVTALNIIFKYYNYESWDNLRKPLTKGFLDDVCEAYDKLLDKINTIEIEDSDRYAIEYILDTYTRKTQIVYLQEINAFNELITYELNELRYEDTLSVCRYFRDRSVELLLGILTYKDKYPEEVFKEVHKNYDLPKKQKMVKEELLKFLEYATDDCKEYIDQDANLIEDIINER